MLTIFCFPLPPQLYRPYFGSLTTVFIGHLGANHAGNTEHTQFKATDFAKRGQNANNFKFPAIRDDVAGRSEGVYPTYHDVR